MIVSVNGWFTGCSLTVSATTVSKTVSKKANVTQIVTTTAHISIKMIHVAVCIDPSS